MDITTLPYVGFGRVEMIQFYQDGRFAGEIAVKDIHYVEESVVEKFLENNLRKEDEYARSIVS